MPRIEYSVDTDVAAERVFAAITDFTDRRPELWPNITPKYYEVHEKGEDWAECTEGTAMAGGVWARERYEWSPGHVRASVIDSNIFRSGVWELRVEPRDGGGSHVEIVNHRQFKGKGLLFVPLLKVAGKRLMTADLHKTLDIIRAEESVTAA